MSLVNTRLQAIRAASAIDQWETRASRWGAFDNFRRMTEAEGGIVSDELKEKARGSIGRALEIPVIDYDDAVGIQNVTQPLVIVGDPSTSQLYAVTFVQYYFGFLIHPAQHRNNEISMQREFQEQIRKYDFKLMDEMDKAALAALEAGKTQFIRDDLGGRYSLTGDVIVAPTEEELAVIGDLDVIMMANDYPGPYTVIGNGSTQSFVRTKLMEKGQFNTDNKTYQYADKSWAWTNNLANDPLHKATGFIVQEGSLGMLEQFNADNLMGHSTHKHTWGIEALPYSGIRMGTFEYDDAVNGSGLAGAASAHLTATKVEAYGFSKGVAFITPYLTDRPNRAAAIAKFGVAKPV